MNYLSVGVLAKYYGVHCQTIRRWCRNGHLSEHHRTMGNHRRFEEPREPEGMTIGYVRVSSDDQKKDLDVQAEALEGEGSKYQDRYYHLGYRIWHELQEAWVQAIAQYALNRQDNASCTYAQRQIAPIRLGDHIHDM